MRFTPPLGSVSFLLGVVFVWSAGLSGTAGAALLDNLEMYYSYDLDTAAPGGIHDGSGNGRDGSGFDKDLGGINYSFSGDVPTALGAGKSLDLSATTDYVISDMPGYVGVLGTSDRTTSSWFKLTGNAFATTLMEWGENASGQRWSVRVNFAANQGPTGRLRTEVTNGFIISDGVVNDGEWHHIAATLESGGSPSMSNVNLYIDGVLQGTSAFAQEPINTTAADLVTIGGSTTFAEDARSTLGLLDDTAIWSRALSGQEVAALAAGAPIPEPSSLIALVLGGTFVMRRRSS